MEQFQLVVNLTPDDVMRRLAASIDQPRVVAINPLSGKDFFGYLNGYQFWIRKRQRWSRNSFAPACTGGVVPNGSGSTINCSIRAKYTFFWILGGIFLLLSLFFSFFIVMIGYVMASGAAGRGMASFLLVFLIPIFVIVFFSGFFFLTKQMGKGDERRLSYFLQSLFRDVIVAPAH